jgi:hypothetical protein
MRFTSGGEHEAPVAEAGDRGVLPADEHPAGLSTQERS